MNTARLRLALLWALLAFLPPAHAQSQAKLAQSCDAEIEQVDKRIAAARKRPEYKTDQGRQALTSADRYLNQARKHAAKGESRHCLEAAKKGRAQISAR